MRRGVVLLVAHGFDFSICTLAELHNAGIVVGTFEDNLDVFTIEKQKREMPELNKKDFSFSLIEKFVEYENPRSKFIGKSKLNFKKN